MAGRPIGRPESEARSRATKPTVKLWAKTNLPLLQEIREPTGKLQTSAASEEAGRASGSERDVLRIVRRSRGGNTWGAPKPGGNRTSRPPRSRNDAAGGSRPLGSSSRMPVSAEVARDRHAIRIPASTARRPRAELPDEPQTTPRPQRQKSPLCRLFNRLSGGGGIRTHGTTYAAQRFSRPPDSTTLAPLRGCADGAAREGSGWGSAQAAQCGPLPLAPPSQLNGRHIRLDMLEAWMSQLSCGPREQRPI